MSMERCGSIVTLVALAAGLLASCGGGNPEGQLTGNPVPASKASVTLLLSSTPNAQLSAYNLTLTSVALVNASGSTVNVLTTAQTAELMHLNGSVEPVVTAEIPPDTYESASVTVSEAGFSCFALDSSGALHVAQFSPEPVSPANVTVTLPQAIKISGSGQAILLNLLTSQSATFPSCITEAFQGWVATPSFELSVVDLAAQPTNSGNGKATNLDGQITSLSTNTSTFNVSAGDGVSWSIATNGGTVFQGISGFSVLVPGMAVDVDAALQDDGTLLATRIAVNDTNTTDVTLWRGPLLFVSNAEPAFTLYTVETRGQLFNGQPESGAWILNFGSATFQISSSLNNLDGLPFNATFDAANMVGGQNVLVTTHVLQFPDSPNYPPAATLILLPQTIDGTITDISSEGGFTTYTITLAAYDPFSILAGQPGQTTLLQTPGNVIVYTDSNTQMLNTTSPTVGSVLRFNGLVFNDNGTLRMDCAEVLDGVAL
jgi:Domain of unknown function (DUF5666)